MKTFVKIPLSDWSSTRFEVPIVRRKLHLRIVKQFALPETVAPKVTGGASRRSAESAEG
jgi:hypothetical protein